MVYTYTEPHWGLLPGRACILRVFASSAAFVNVKDCSYCNDACAVRAASIPACKKRQPSGGIRVPNDCTCVRNRNILDGKQYWNCNGCAWQGFDLYGTYAHMAAGMGLDSAAALARIRVRRLLAEPGGSGIYQGGRELTQRIPGFVVKPGLYRAAAVPDFTCVKPGKGCCLAMASNGLCVPVSAGGPDLPGGLQHPGNQLCCSEFIFFNFIYRHIGFVR